MQRFGSISKKKSGRSYFEVQLFEFIPVLKNANYVEYPTMRDKSHKNRIAIDAVLLALRRPEERHLVWLPPTPPSRRNWVLLVAPLLWRCGLGDDEGKIRQRRWSTTALGKEAEGGADESRKTRQGHR